MQLDSKLSIENLDQAVRECINGCQIIRSYIESNFKKYINEALETLNK